MLHDHYKIRGDMRRGRQTPSISFDKFINGFISFFNQIQMGKNPSLLHKYCDPYGFALLCSDYNIKGVNINASCKDNFEQRNGKEDHPYLGMFDFYNLLNFLHRAYWFDKKLAIDIYKAQNSPVSIFKQIIGGQGFIENRFRYDKKSVRKYMNYAIESKLALDENYPIPKPFIHHVCDGMVWPCIVTRNDSISLKDKSISLHGWGEGLFVVDGNNKILDVIRINDLSLIENPLENRLRFMSKVKSDDYEQHLYAKAWNWNEALEYGKLMGANSRDGLLIRSCHENYLNNHWFAWNKNSYIYCYNIHDQLRAMGQGNAMPDFYTLEGEPGEPHPFEERATERVWLDDFDIKVFKRILELK